jgi:hypothetical protein
VAQHDEPAAPGLGGVRMPFVLTNLRAMSIRPSSAGTRRRATATLSAAMFRQR